LQPVDNSKYLGVTVSNDLDCGPHINYITTKTNKTLAFLRRNMKNCKHCSLRVRASRLLVRDSPVVRRHYILLLEPSNVRAQYIQKNCKPRELGKDMADEFQPRKMLCHPCYQEENSL
jgi:hypothetical protein